MLYDWTEWVRAQEVLWPAPCTAPSGSTAAVDKDPGKLAAVVDTVDEHQHLATTLQSTEIANSFFHGTPFTEKKSTFQVCPEDSPRAAAAIASAAYHGLRRLRLRMSMSDCVCRPTWWQSAPLMRCPQPWPFCSATTKYSGPRTTSWRTASTTSSWTPLARSPNSRNECSAVKHCCFWVKESHLVPVAASRQASLCSPDS